MTTEAQELRIGLLFQYLQEIKMKIVALKSIKRFHQGQELAQIEFINIERSTVSDEIAREMLQCDPQLVLKVLQVDE